MSTSPLRGRFEFWVLGFESFVRDVGRALPVRRRQFEAVENKSGCNRTADECPISKAPRRLPGAPGNKRLRALTRVQIHADVHGNNLLILAINRKRKRCSSVPMPDFDRVDPMPMGSFTGRQ